jgi:hypothetical protein
MASLNFKHFNKILAHIRGDLKRLWMPEFGIKKGTGAAEATAIKGFPLCGTAACFAGWSRLLSIPKKDWKNEFNEYGELQNVSFASEGIRLGLTEEEAYKLFDGAYGTRRQQFETVKIRLRNLITARVAAGELTAKKIKL